MKKNAVVTSFILMCVLFAIGIVLIFSAPAAGQNAGSTAIRNHGGSMDTNQYLRIIESTSDAYRTGGMVISLVGGFGLLASGYILLKEERAS